MSATPPYLALREDVRNGELRLARGGPPPWRPGLVALEFSRTERTLRAVYRSRLLPRARVRAVAFQRLTHVALRAEVLPTGGDLALTLTARHDGGETVVAFRVAGLNRLGEARDLATRIARATAQPRAASGAFREAAALEFAWLSEEPASETAQRKTFALLRHEAPGSTAILASDASADYDGDGPAPLPPPAPASRARSTGKPPATRKRWRAAVWLAAVAAVGGLCRSVLRTDRERAMELDVYRGNPYAAQLFDDHVAALRDPRVLDAQARRCTPAPAHRLRCAFAYAALRAAGATGPQIVQRPEGSALFIGTLGADVFGTMAPLPNWLRTAVGGLDQYYPQRAPSSPRGNLISPAFARQYAATLARQDLPAESVRTLLAAAFWVPNLLPDAERGVLLQRYLAGLTAPDERAMLEEVARAREQLCDFVADMPPEEQVWISITGPAGETIRPYTTTEACVQIWFASCGRYAATDNNPASVFAPVVVHIAVDNVPDPRVLSWRNHRFPTTRRALAGDDPPHVALRLQRGERSVSVSIPAPNRDYPLDALRFGLDDTLPSALYYYSFFAP